MSPRGREAPGGQAILVSIQCLQHIVHLWDELQSQISSSDCGGPAQTPPCTHPPVEAVPRIQVGTRNEEQSERLPRPRGLSAHSPLQDLFSALPPRPPLKLFFLLLFFCFHTPVSVSCEPSLRKRHTAKAASVRASRTSGCLATPLLASPGQALHVLSALQLPKARGLLGVRGLNAEREANESNVFYPFQKRLNAGV